MKKSLLTKMRQLSNQGYSFVRASDYYQLETLLPNEIDAELDTVKDTPAYRSGGRKVSMKRVFLLVIDPQNGVVATIWLNGRHGERMLERCCDKLLES